MLTLPHLDEFLRSGGVLLVPNHQGAQQWQDKLGVWRCQQSQRRVVAAPAIHAIDLWLSQLWQQLALQCTAPELGWRVLSPGEEELLWQQLLDEQELLSLLNTQGTARHLREAGDLLQLWRVSLQELRNSIPGSEAATDNDTLIAWRWLQAFERQCRQQQLLRGSEQLAILLRLLQEQGEQVRHLLPSKVWWLGFDDPPPLYRDLQLSMQKLGIELLAITEPQECVQGAVHVYPDMAHEMRAAALWCEQLLQGSPLARIGIVCPTLYSQAPALLRIFKQHLPAHEIYCSVMPTLAQHAFLNTALQCLTLMETECDSLSLCQLLRSPWLRGAREETTQRSALELRLRKQGELQTQSTSLREYCAQQEKPWHCPVLANVLPSLHALTLRYKHKQSLSAWLALFQQYWQQLLAMEDLMQERSLQEAWQRWCDAIAHCSSLFGAMTRQRALQLLHALAGNISLPHTRGNAAVRILTPVEAAGLQFTHLWVLQLHAEAWPPPAQPNPLLPLKLQRERVMPAADPTAELKRARHQWQRWHHAASEQLVLSYPQQMNELPVEPSPFLAGLQVQTATPLAVPASLHPVYRAFPPNQLVLQTEERLLPPAPSQLQGPSSLLSSQAACPFKAFATQRLGARELPAFQLGLQASVVGELLHKVLQQFWLSLRDSIALGDSTRSEIALQQAITDGLRAIARRYPHTLTPRFRQLEAQRLQALLARWLEVERERRPFQVLMTEYELQWHWQQLQVNVRLDRVDRSEHGLLVVDYKTGRVKNPDWQSERPRDPQLLLYHAALASQLPEEPTVGLLYARITLDELAFSGITATDEGLSTLAFDSHKGLTAENWAALEQHWQQVLGALAQEYLQGLVIVEPKFHDSCQYCHLPSLCRIDELQRLQESGS